MKALKWLLHTGLIFFALLMLTWSFIYLPWAMFKPDYQPQYLTMEGVELWDPYEVASEDICVILYSAPWCEPCKHQLAALRVFVADYEAEFGDPIEIIIVNTDGGVEATQEYIDEDQIAEVVLIGPGPPKYGGTTPVVQFYIRDEGVWMPGIEWDGLKTLNEIYAYLQEGTADD
jgi:hypothetical protein